MWHSAKIRPTSPPLGLSRIVAGDELAQVGDPRGLEVAQEHHVVEVAHRVEVAEAHAFLVNERCGH